MAENKDGQEKSELPSRKRLLEAQERGNVAKSTDVTTAGLILLGGLTVYLFGDNLFDTYKGFMSTALMNSSSITIDDESIVRQIHIMIGFLAKILLPIIAVIFLIAYAGEVSQVGFQVASKKFTEGLKWKQIFNPFSGLKKIFFSKRSIFELIKSLAKILVLGLVVVFTLRGRDEEIIALLEKPYFEIGNYMASISIELVIKVGVVYIVIAVSDALFQKWQHKEDLKMTKQEVKDENKQSEGDPMVKARMRQIMRSKIRSAMMKSTAEADVVITNPTHYAVALKYEMGQMTAPKVVAKGADFLAARIREIATDNNVPIVEEPPLARAIYFNVEVDDEIPENLFKAVAQILAYIYNLKKK
jgi:flagellar biosynthetic protein FlhB